MEAIAVLIAVSVISLLGFFLKVTLAVTVADPKFAAKAFASGLSSSVIGYFADGHVAIKVVLWGAGGFLLYAAYKYVFDRA